MRVRIPGPPEELVRRVRELFRYAWDRGWNKLIGSGLTKLYEHNCRGDVFNLVLADTATTEGLFRVGHCAKCECFFYIGPVNGSTPTEG